MDQVAITGSINWQVDTAPPDAVNFLDSINYTDVVSFELSVSSSLETFSLDGGLHGESGPDGIPFVTAVYAEVYFGSVAFQNAGTPGDGTISVYGSPVGSISPGVPVSDLIGRFMYTCPTDDAGNRPPSSPTSMSATANYATAKIWTFLRIS